MIRAAARNALALAHEMAVASLALPVLGSGSAGMPEPRALELMLAALGQQNYPGRVLIVRHYGRNN